MKFEFEIKEHKKYVDIKLKGDLIDKIQSQSLIDKIDEYIQNDIYNFTFDLKDLKYINSSGLNVLIQIYTKARNNNGEVVLYHLNKKINELLLITKLNTIFKIADTQKDAVKLLNVE
ncbi:MAG: STAS domain-containing protein [Bacteroidia bacterium]|nr:STAS domain-containing protein [Bacteroidia bacterium]